MNKIYKPNFVRLTVVFFIFLGLYFLLIFNLYILQIARADYFINLGAMQYNFFITKMASRGLMYDKNDQILALNKDSVAAFIVPSQITDMVKLKDFLSKYFPNSLQRLQKSKNSQFMYIKRRMSFEQIELIKKNNIVDIKFLNEPSRYYPIESLAHLIGITDIDNNGVVGLELLYNSILAGKPAKYILEKDARSGYFYFRQTTLDTGISGNFIKTTLDSNLQFLVYEDLKKSVEKFGSKEGSVLILDALTGDVVSMATYPTFNPNESESLDIENSKNRIVADVYELGSVVKVFLALAALEEKAVSVDDLIDCENSKSTTLNGISFTTWKAHGIIKFIEVMRGSNNIGVAKVALKLQKKLYDHYVKLGFGKKISILPGENKGYVNHPKLWSKASPISLSFGYEISANLLQLAQAFTVLANDGCLVKPNIIFSSNLCKSQPLYSFSTISDLRKILYLNNSDSKICKKFYNKVDIFGKTGTARLLTNGIYDVNRNIFTYLGLIEKNNYKRIVVTFLKETTQKNAYSSTTAALLFQDIVQTMLIHDGLV